MGSNFFKVLAASLVMCFVFFGLSVFAIKKAIEQNSDSIVDINGHSFKVSDLVTMSGPNIDLHFSNTDMSDKFENTELKEKVTSLEISGVSADWVLEGSEEATLKIQATGKIDKSKDPHLLLVERTGPKLELKTPKDEKGLLNLKVKILVPKSWLQSLSIKTVSGDVKVNSLTVQQIDFESVSGDFESEILQAERLSVSALSADVQIKNSDINQLTGELVSGDLTMTDMKDFSGSWTSMSGDVEVSYAKPPRTDFMLKAISGSVQNRYGQPDKATSKFQVNLTSGDIQIE